MTSICSGLAILVLIAAMGCAKTPASQEPSANGGAQGMTEANLLAFLEAANQADAHSGQLAQRKAADPHVGSYARRMVTDHDRLLKSVQETASRLKMTPRLGPGAQRLLREHIDAMAALQDRNGRSFDRDYLAHEISMHQHLLQVLDQAAQEGRRSEITRLVGELRPAFEDHLRAAKVLQQRIGRKS